MKQVKKII